MPHSWCMKRSKNVPRLIPLGAMAFRLGIAARNLRAEAREGRVPCIRVGKDGLLFDPRSVEAALLVRAAQSKAQAVLSPLTETSVSPITTGTDSAVTTAAVSNHKRSKEADHVS